MIFQLRSPHTTPDGAYLETGTLVDDKRCGITGNMVPVDEEAREAFEAAYQWDPNNQRFVRKGL